MIDWRKAKFKTNHRAGVFGRDLEIVVQILLSSGIYVASESARESSIDARKDLVDRIVHDLHHEIYGDVRQKLQEIWSVAAHTRADHAQYAHLMSLIDEALAMLRPPKINDILNERTDRDGARSSFLSNAIESGVRCTLSPEDYDRVSRAFLPERETTASDTATEPNVGKGGAS